MPQHEQSNRGACLNISRRAPHGGARAPMQSACLSMQSTHPPTQSKCLFMAEHIQGRVLQVCMPCLVRLFIGLWS